MGYEVVHAHPRTMTVLTIDDVESLGDGKVAWDHVNTFACSISGPAWRMKRIADSDIRRWTKSDDRWWRRAALVSMVALNVKNQGGSGDVPRTLDICSRLAADCDDMVEKALSWALWCLIGHEPAAVREFLRSNEDLLGARVRREVNNKLETGLKNPARR